MRRSQNAGNAINRNVGCVYQTCRTNWKHYVFNDPIKFFPIKHQQHSDDRENTPSEKEETQKKTTA